GWRGGSAADKEEIIQAKGPWPSKLEVYDPETRQTYSGMVGLKDAITFLIQSRQAEEAGLHSVFVHVLEPRTPGQAPVVADVRVAEAESISSGGGAAATLTLADGATLVAATTLGDATYRTPGIELTGRFGAAIPERACFTLFDGVRLEAGGWSIETEPSWEMELVGVIGDVTGHPAESALVVRTPRPLPTDSRLVGDMVYVEHQGHKQLRSVYRIGKITPWGPEQYRIDIAWTAPFITYRMRVLDVDETDPTVLTPDFPMGKGSGWRNHAGQRIRFLDSGWETELLSAGRASLTLKEAPPEGAVKKGTPFIVYAVQPGDRVRIPSHVAITGRTEDEAMHLDVQATSRVRLRVPEAYSVAIVSPVAREAGQDTVPKPIRNRLELTEADLADGRVQLRLRPPDENSTMH
ncbi:MAG: hypothetical protein K9N51_11840, partial [Candidatus Pacebacteria bacterium]|nr:hypothetical protein [Candidatus Paceibacterota bacterium]